MRRSEMDKANKPAPFGLLFEEPASRPPNPILPVYDEDTDLSYVEDSDGHQVPYVEFVSAIGTETNTRIAVEAPDEDKDYPGQLAGTHTVTKMQLEPTDPDPENDTRLIFGNAGTQTATAVEVESSDTDPEDDEGYSIIVQRSLATTDTFTEQDIESTDTD
jgi:hypothetical protein